MPKVIDGLTGVEFADYKAYLAHVSPVTGFKPTDPEHQGKRGLLVSKKALSRTGSLDKGKEKEIDVKVADIEEKQVQKKLAEHKAIMTEKMLSERPFVKEANTVRRIANKKAVGGRKAIIEKRKEVVEKRKEVRKG